MTSPPSGILKVTLIQTRDVPFPTTSATPPGSGYLRGPRPYAIVDFDKSQIISYARYVHPSLYEPLVCAGEGEVLPIICTPTHIASMSPGKLSSGFGYLSLLLVGLM